MKKICNLAMKQHKFIFIDAYFSFLISAFALLREEIDDDCKNINEMTE
jgi:hypothetical protein